MAGRSILPHIPGRTEAVSIRYAGAHDAAALARLAQLDSRPFPAGAILVAEIEGELVAALPVSGGPAIADPFRWTADLVALLAMRAKQLRAAERRFERARLHRRRGLRRAAVAGEER